ncbi:MAG: DUF72 domain-containing protein [Chloroflexota bacterium]|nr:DUF72 domain-containing protein [Rhodospirillaceae bacterium]MDE2768667.1 DUF72 domain-containing protein [Chloroflexota bacterium]MDE2899166.1 DUF72 domain-containing protein [Chloroflexota bacterium]
MTAVRRYGTRGWQRLKEVYPPRTRPNQMLGVYAEHATVVEAENVFSGIPKPERVQEWVDQTPDGFKFDVVAFGGLTLYQRRPGTDPRRKKSWTEIAVEPPGVLFEDLQESMEPLRAADRLGAVILQFPPWFEAGNAGRDYLGRVREGLSDLPLAVEFRHPTWQVPVNQESTLETLIELEMGTVVADLPSETDEWYPPFDMTTVDDLAIVRLHGQNAEGWARTVQSPVEAVAYSYEDSDLATWVARIRSLSLEAAEVHVLVDTAPPDAALASAKALAEAVDAADEAEARWGYVP